VKPYEIEDWIDFLKDHDFVNIQDMGEWIMANCIFHNQTDLLRPSLGINKITGVGNCLGCGSHSWYEICKKLDISVVELIDGVKEKEWDKFKNKIQKQKEIKKVVRYKLPKELKNPFTHKGASIYLKEQGIGKDALKKYKVRICMDKTSKYFEHIIFPVEDEKGILFFDARYVGKNKDRPRWQRPKNCAFWKTMWNWNNVKYKQTVIFVEGISDAIKLSQFGLSVIPLKSPSKRQFKEVLYSPIENIVLLYDNDEAGRWKKNKKGKPIHFTAKAFEYFNDCGKNIIVGHLPKGASDPAKIRNLKSLQCANPTIKHLLK